MFWANFRKGEKPYFYCHKEGGTYNVCKVFLEDKHRHILDIKTKEIVALDYHDLLGETIEDKRPLRFKKSKDEAVNSWGVSCPHMTRYEVENGISAFDGDMNISVHSDIKPISIAFGDDDFLKSNAESYINEGYGIVCTSGYIPRSTKYSMRDEYVVTKRYVPVGIINHICPKDGYESYSVELLSIPLRKNEEK